MIRFYERNHTQHVMRTLRQQRVVVAIRVAGKFPRVFDRPILLGRLVLWQKLALKQQIDAENRDPRV